VERGTRSVRGWEKARVKSSLTCKRTGAVRLVKHVKRGKTNPGTFRFSQDSAGRPTKHGFFTVSHNEINGARVVLYLARGALSPCVYIHDTRVAVQPPSEAEGGAFLPPSTVEIKCTGKLYYYRETGLTNHRDPRDRVGRDGLGSFFVCCATPPAVGF
jgi:hypothetical protein